MFQFNINPVVMCNNNCIYQLNKIYNKFIILRKCYMNIYEHLTLNIIFSFSFLYIYNYIYYTIYKSINNNNNK